MDILNMGTCNMRRITGRKIELDQEFDKVRPHILGVTEIKKKARGEKFCQTGTC